MGDLQQFLESTVPDKGARERLISYLAHLVEPHKRLELSMLLCGTSQGKQSAIELFRMALGDAFNNTDKPHAIYIQDHSPEPTMDVYSRVLVVPFAAGTPGVSQEQLLKWREPFLSLLQTSV